MAEAGEASGKLDESLGRLAETLDRAEALRQTIVSSLVYPALLLVRRDGRHSDDAAVRRAAVRRPVLRHARRQAAVHDAGGDGREPCGARRTGCSAALVLVVGVVVLYRWLEDPAGSSAPSIGRPAGSAGAWSVMRNAETARFARTLGSLLDGGVPLPTALGIAQRSIANVHMSESIDRVTRGLKQGGGLSGPLAATGLFPPMALSFLRTGEETAQLGLMLNRLADVLDRDVRNCHSAHDRLPDAGDHGADGRHRCDRHRLHHVCNLGLQRFGARTMKKTLAAFRRGEAGFTLLELLVVLAILGLLAAIIAPQVIKYLGTSRTQTAKVQIQNVVAALELYRLDVGRYPTPQEGLKALVTRRRPPMAGTART